jgi:hypothetical protein
VEGTFTLPADRARTCQFLMGMVTVSARSIRYEGPLQREPDGSPSEELHEHFVEHRVAGGARTESRSSDPRLLFDGLGKRLANAQTRPFSATVMHEALSMAPSRKVRLAHGSHSPVIRVQNGVLSSPTFAFECVALGRVSGVRVEATRRSTS